jgi:hypothetical protein
MGQIKIYYFGKIEKASVRFRHPFANHVEDLPVGFMGGVKSRGIDKDEFVSVFFMVQDSMC